MSNETEPLLADDVVGETKFFGTEEEALERIRTVADLLDGAFEVPGTDYEIGLDPILGVVPAGGDATAAVISLYIVLEAANLGVPRNTILKMLALVGIDVVVGSVPLLGTVFDAVWKANQWNVSMIEEHVDSR